MPTLGKILAVDHKKKTIAVDKKLEYKPGPAKIFNPEGQHVGTHTITDVKPRDAFSLWLTLDGFAKKIRDGFQVLQ
jgi:hypothetical protein